MWVLILAMFSLNDHGQIALSIANVSGFSTKEVCVEAGLVAQDLKPPKAEREIEVRFVCVRQVK